jgi:hypothetical protein
LILPEGPDAELRPINLSRADFELDDSLLVECD